MNDERQPPSPPFSMYNVQEGQVIAGDYRVSVVCHDRTIRDQELELLMDGRAVNVGYGDFMPRGSPVQTISFGLPTPNIANGSHVLTVRYSDRSPSPTPYQETRTVRLENAISNLNITSLQVRGSDDEWSSVVCHITASLTPPQPWRIHIQDYKQQTVCAFQGDGAAINADWVATDSRGLTVEAGYYTIDDTASRTGQVVERGINKFRLLRND